ncbi:MAG: polyribonucleotide nucleotidyltransferase [Actinomycetaceae bacterium]|nr:polyribonucleotide nucleotidyltransferase [Actinomycetaceae bacterium]MDY6083000.1 polyribonucleotide nucleotidyltransferase [Actinomycetaceae bacterium]
MEGPNVHFSEAVIDNGSFGKRTIRFETGVLAQQAGGAALAYLDGETTVFSATTVSKEPKEHFDFFPLTVDVEEKSYAAGKIPGGFFRREGKPGMDAILAARLIDRPLRPAFIKGMRNEVQVHAQVLTVHPDDAYDVLAINAASMSTSLTDLPFNGPVGGTRMALIDGQWVAFPRWAELERATFSMAIAGRVVGDDVAVMMVEAQAPEGADDVIKAGGTKPTEDVVAQGMEAAKPVIRTLVEAQAKLRAECGKATKDYPLFPDYTDEQLAAVREHLGDSLSSLLGIVDKLERSEKLGEIIAQTQQALAEQFPESEAQIDAAVNYVFKQMMRDHVLRTGERMDGRTPVEIRTITAQAGVLPRVHGSALFQRGETQVLGVTTLATLKMEMQLDNLTPYTYRRFFTHYNFPPYSVGETGRVGSPKRREIGHGHLAQMALESQLPSVEEFPYTIRQVAETMGSNGSSSMASTTVSTMSMYNAGVPLKASVAGIAMGLITGEVDGQQAYVTLTDILGAEDAMGDMDFKVAGTRDYVTALQLDTKLTGIPAQVLAGALAQAHDARLAILDIIDAAISGPDELAETAPRIITVAIPADKIGEVIGPKGKMIKQIQEETGAEITIEEDGTVYIASNDGPSADSAREMINSIANPQLPREGERFMGTVVKTTSFGAFIALTPGRDGLLHISQVRRLVGGKRVDAVEDVLNVGDKVEVEVVQIDPRGKVSLQAVVDGETGEPDDASPDRSAQDDHSQHEHKDRRRTVRRGSRQRRRTHEGHSSEDTQGDKSESTSAHAGNESGESADHDA